MIALTIYSRPGCHLCEEMLAVVRRVAGRVPLAVQEVDISGDAALEARYGTAIPVLVVEGKTVATSRVTEDELRRIVATVGPSTST
jgi:hypothetical protein